jgi:membrane protein YqaA with SNARE-associated domain
VPILALFAYAFLSNVALAIVPHEPAVLWAGPRLGIWPTALAATAGTVLAALVDHLAFVPLLTRLQARRPAGAATGRIQRWFARAPFAILTLSGLTPLPFFPFKALAFTARYPLGRYCAAVAAGPAAPLPAARLARRRGPPADPAARRRLRAAPVPNPEDAL